MAAVQRAPTYELTGRVALIPGGLGGVGQAVSRAFVEAGAVVVAAGTGERAQELAALRVQLGDSAARLDYRQADVLDEGQVEQLVWRVVEDRRHLDILVNLVGGWKAGEPVAGLELATWRQMQELNAQTAFLLAKHAARPMVQQSWGRIIHVSSRGARSGRRNAAAYAVAKGAVLTLTEIQAEELRDAGVTVNAILPMIVCQST
jgi:NAD(P)-dependent dehydrogenase (short-subunit alcohol dehydrogenase family)